jgi:hypothetical protein
MGVQRAKPFAGARGVLAKSLLLVRAEGPQKNDEWFQLALHLSGGKEGKIVRN